jgi:hypothetical protein
MMGKFLKLRYLWVLRTHKYLNFRVFSKKDRAGASRPYRLC